MGSKACIERGCAFRRMEIRNFLKVMKGNDQKNYFARYGDDLPAEVAMAILSIEGAAT